MNNSIFGAAEPEDPWGNEWASSRTDNFKGTSSMSMSMGLSPSQYEIANNRATDSLEGSISSQFVAPSSYKKIYEANNNLDSTPKLEAFLQRLVTGGFLTSNQLTKLLKMFYDNSLLPASVPNNFYQIIGLVSLEISEAGGADYVTFHFKKDNLPDLPQEALNALLGLNKSKLITSNSIDNHFTDPLNENLANVSINDSVNEFKSLVDPILTDHSDIPHSQIANNSTVNEASESEISKYINDLRDSFKPWLDSTSVVKIKEVPEKEGLLFKHINYNITHNLNLGTLGPAGTKKVIRRYSDFVWLLEYLLKKYPFRVIPGLPPKKFNGSSLDSQFLQKRRRGLHRFLNQLVRHPILIQEPVVITFLSVPTDLATWRKQAKIDNSIEFKGCKISTDFIERIWPVIGEEFLKNWQKAEQEIGKLIETWTKIVLLVERHEKRQQQISYDNQKFSEMLNNFMTFNIGIYPIPDTNNSQHNNVISSTNTDDMTSLNDSLGALSRFFIDSRQLLLDDSFSINTSLLEKFKNYLDYLYSLQELFERSKNLSGNSIPELQKKIQDSEKNFAKLSNDDVDIKGSELAKLRQSIINDKQELFQQLNRDWLIKECCFKEFIMFQETQYLVGEMWVEWAKDRNTFQQNMFNLQDNINERIAVNMPQK